MAAKKKTGKKQAKSKTSAAAKKITPMKNMAKKKLAVKRKGPKKQAKRKEVRKSAAAGKTKSGGKKKTTAKTVSAPKKHLPKRNRTTPIAFSRDELGEHSGGQSGDLQGLSRVEGADSESVDELLEEGNAFEADVVAGVESAGDGDEKEVRTHEVREDDVPGEYLDKD